ncbi:dicarboxylate/amino acid:cation symporter [Stratiformator vulcanicus]|uniref:Proton/sodium-glutamate symport protein n=1 Tax=Stratiformator vulcanicus TaxID=2527980 RepID=A0A517QWB5_9PLAN|nr:dicarboxylate/amino acid:cation symporter [Stratiformator vulcanicus]QDT35860.1 Proton/sodium-glutamate symport protein [Stratiformator vulcanicus]
MSDAANEDRPDEGAPTADIGSSGQAASPPESPTESQKKAHSGNRLTLYILIGIIAAVTAAFVAPEAASMTAVGGEIFLSLLKMIVVPLVVTSVMSGILGLGDVRKLGRPGLYAITYYLSTTVLAVIVGLICVNIIYPGGNISEEQKAKAEQEADKKDLTAEARLRQQERQRLEEEITKYNAALDELGEDGPADEIAQMEAELAASQNRLREIKKQDGLGAIFANLLTMLFTENLFESAVKMDLLPLIGFSLIFAAMLTTLGERVDSLTQLIDQTNHALLAFVMLLMNVAPLGIFCLVASRFGEAQLEGRLGDELQQIGGFMATVLIGLGIHAFVTLPAIYWICTRKNPYVFMYQMSQALLTAFSTASSSATLPVTMETATQKAGVSAKSVEFVVPIGATINMDGTALYEAAAAIFIAQAVAAGDPTFVLTLQSQIIVAVTATLAAIGAAGIPEAGLFTMVIVLNAVGLPVEYIGLILSVDWLLDRFRTAVNVFGDSIGAAVVEKSIPDDAVRPGAG